MSADALRPPTENRILASLPREDYERIAPHLETVRLARGQIIYHTDEPIEHVYFPTNSMVSVVSQLADGSSVEVGVTGFEGMVGLPVLLGVDRSPHECMTQIADGAMRAGAGAIKEEFRRGGALHDLLLRFTHSLLLLIANTAACNRAHTVSERLARWLLLSHDRCAGDELPLTQEFLSMMLGSRRASVTEAAVVLQAEGLIKYRRARIVITDRPGLEDFACECYGILKADFTPPPLKLTEVQRVFLPTTRATTKAGGATGVRHEHNEREPADNLPARRGRGDARAAGG